MKRLLITGASSGIGQATALEAAKQGWEVIACGRNESRLRALTGSHDNIDYLAFDITDLDACRQALTKQDVDAVVLNAGVCEYVDISDWDSAMFKRVFDANFFGVVNCLEVLLPQLSSGKQLVFVDSLARLLPFTRSQAYGASKAALYYLAKSTEVDLEGSGITIKTVSPGFVKTPLTDKNDFHMPMRIEATEAAKSIISILNKDSRTNYFPNLFASIIRVLSSLPPSWQVALCRKMKKS